MAGNRQYESATLFNVRVVDMRHLWTPSNEFKGQQTQKPNWFGVFITPKTQAHWSQEPIFAGVMGAFGKLLQGQLQAYAGNVMAVNWPISDGDMPTPEGKTSDFAKGHWVFSASTGNAPNVEIAQPNGQVVKLQNKVGVKSGDYAMLGVTAAVKKNAPNGVKFYLNAVVFTAPGEEIVFANSVTGAELMRLAQQQGLTVAGFQSSPAGGGFGAPQGGGGFPTQPQGQAGGFPGTPHQGQQGGFAPPNGAGGFAPGAAPGLGGTPNGPNGNVTSPSNFGQFQQPPAGGGFGQPFPGGGFPGR